MNNQQFRRLVLDTPARQDGGAKSPQSGATPSSLGSRKSAFVPMTPRHIKGSAGADFARQVAERNAAAKPSKNFKSFAPRGVKLAKGYKDRALERMNEEEGDEEGVDDREARIRALEEQVKLGQLDRAVFEKLRDQITGGEVESTHLIKGLDRQLLQRVRRGEDVMGTGEGTTTPGGDVDEEFEALEEKEVAPMAREKAVKKGEMAPPSAVAGTKRSRDDILADLKAQRQAAAAAKIAARPELGDKFRSISAPRDGPRIVKDSKGREVLVTKDEHGNIKKRVRKVAEPFVEDKISQQKPYKMLDDGITIPQPKTVAPVEPEKEESDDEIFAGVGMAYNPLGEEPDSSSSENEESTPATSAKPAVAPDPTTGTSDLEEGEEIETPDTPPRSPVEVAPETTAAVQPQDTSTVPAQAPAPSKPRNYFASTKTTVFSTDDSSDHQTRSTNPLNDAAFLETLQRAGALAKFKLDLSNPNKANNGSRATDAEADASEEGLSEAEKAKKERLRKRAAMLAAADRDLEDMDLGFGDTRYGDEEEDEGGEGEGGRGKKVKLSEWKGFGAEEDEGEDGGQGGQGGQGGGARKKRSRKRKGDKDSAKDVLGVLERRKEGAK